MLFRRRFFLAAAMAAAVGLVGPPTAQAGFALTMTSGSATHTASGPGSGPGAIVVNQVGFNGFDIGVVATTNSPGGAFNGSVVGRVFSTTFYLTNNSDTAQRIRFEIYSDGFTRPGGPGEQLFLTTSATSLYGLRQTDLGSAATQTHVFSQVESPIGSVVASTDPSGFHSLGPTSFPVQSGPISFIRGDDYAIRLVVDVYVGARQSVHLAADSVVATPAPPGLILAATAAPFFGLLRRLRRRNEAPTA
jgi:hypothetical protein